MPQQGLLPQGDIIAHIDMYGNTESQQPPACSGSAVSPRSFVALRVKAMLRRGLPLIQVAPQCTVLPAQPSIDPA